MHKKLLICVCAATALVALSCNETKTWRKSPECGNQIIEVGEECDIVTDKLCINYDSTKIWEDGGRPGCNTACRLTIGTCVEKNSHQLITCGNGELDNGEECDGTLFANAADNCVTYLGEGATGQLSCLNCKITTTGCVAPDKCGNGQLDENEKCDGDLFGDATCSSLLEGSSGSLSCIACTTIDTTGCEVPNLCNNGDIDENEECDGTDIGDATCEDGKGEGATGTVTCSSTCKLDYSQCRPASCGNGDIDSVEECDGENLNGKTCGDVVSGTEGTLACDSNCNFDTTLCETVDPCGNGQLDDGEECDGDDFGNETCHTQDSMSIGGTLLCSDSCRILLTNCEYFEEKCGNSILDPGEECDKAIDMTGVSCTTLDDGSIGGDLKCGDNCLYDKSSCEYNTQVECGDGNIQGEEECEGTDFGGKNCVNYKGEGATGELSCNTTTCKIDFSACVAAPVCGDGEINGTDECEGDDFGGKTCETYKGEGATGALVCSSCQIDSSACVAAPICGDGVINGDDECEGEDFGGKTCETYKGEGATGDLICNSCVIDASNCAAASTCGDGEVNGDDECDGEDFGGKTCETYKGEGATGALACNSCVIDASGCVAAPICGDGEINGTDECDGDNIGSAVCPDGTNGTPVCKSDCTLDMSETVCVPETNTCNNNVLDAGEACDPSVVSYDDIACTSPNLYSASAFAIGSISCSNTCEIVEDCTDKTAEDFTVTPLYNTCYGGLLSNSMVRFSDDTQKRNMTYRHELRGITWTLSDIVYSSEDASLSLGNWWAGSNGAPNAVKYIQHELLKTTEGEKLENNNCEYTTLGSRIIDDFDYIAVQIDFRRVNSNSPKKFAVVLYEGDEFKAVLKNFTAESFTKFNTTGEITFSIKGMTNPIVRIQSYEKGGPMYFRNYQVRGLNVK